MRRTPPASRSKGISSLFPFCLVHMCSGCTNVVMLVKTPYRFASEKAILFCSIPFSSVGDSRFSSINAEAGSLLYVEFMSKPVFCLCQGKTPITLHLLYGKSNFVLSVSGRRNGLFFIGERNRVTAFQTPQAQARRRKKRSGSGPFSLHSQPRRSRKVGH